MNEKKLTEYELRMLKIMLLDKIIQSKDMVSSEPYKQILMKLNYYN